MQVAVALHVLAAAAWVGGMAFALYVMRPGLAALAPPQRVGVMARVFARFLPMVGGAIVVIVATGALVLVQRGGLRGLGWGVHTMLAAGVVMIAVYGWLVAALNPRLQAAASAQDWPAGGAAAERMRRAVTVNLVLGVIAIAAAVAGRGA